MIKWDNLQHVDSNSGTEKCHKCGKNLLDVFNIKYAGETRAAPTFTEERYECRNCKTPFILRYELFEKNGHITTRTFSGDVNDPTHNWQNNLTDEQSKLVSEHLETCPVCQDKANEEILKDAWFSSILRRKG